MAKNISNNQWFNDIIDDVYINTAAINDILIIVVSCVNQIESETTIAKLRDKNLFNFLGKVIEAEGKLMITTTGELKTIRTFSKQRLTIMVPLKSKQLETDFYSPEQLAEMYPNDPAYHIATDELTDETKPVVDPIDDMEVT